jgi:hypothetical protein
VVHDPAIRELLRWFGVAILCALATFDLIVLVWMIHDRPPKGAAPPPAPPPPEVSNLEMMANAEAKRRGR